MCEPVTVLIDGMCVPFDKDIVVEQVEGHSVLVSWEAPKYEGTELAGYNVFRGSEQLNADIITELSYLDKDLEPNYWYFYQVEVVYNDCEDTLKSNIAPIAIVSIAEISAGSMVQIYPNPTRGELIIESGELRVERVDIFDVFGRKVFEQKVTSPDPSKGEESPFSFGEGQRMRFDLTVLPSGVYFIKVETENGSVIRKLVVE
jgi:hypothetical protein